MRDWPVSALEGHRNLASSDLDEVAADAAAGASNPVRCLAQFVQA
jgi:hypothetical protein